MSSYDLQYIIPINNYVFNWGCNQNGCKINCGWGSVVKIELVFTSFGQKFGAENSALGKLLKITILRCMDISVGFFENAWKS